MYQIWKEAVDEIADVEGLIPTFVYNLAPRTAARVALNNGVGNVWGTDDVNAYISKSTSHSAVISDSKQHPHRLGTQHIVGESKGQYTS